MRVSPQWNLSINIFQKERSGEILTEFHLLWNREGGRTLWFYRGTTPVGKSPWQLLKVRVWGNSLTQHWLAEAADVAKHCTSTTCLWSRAHQHLLTGRSLILPSACTGRMTALGTHAPKVERNKSLLYVLFGSNPEEPLTLCVIIASNSHHNQIN